MVFLLLRLESGVEIHPLATLSCVGEMCLFYTWKINYYLISRRSHGFYNFSSLVRQKERKKNSAFLIDALNPPDTHKKYIASERLW